jgi:hypothetical protein
VVSYSYIVRRHHYDICFTICGKNQKLVSEIRRNPSCMHDPGKNAITTGKWIDFESKSEAKINK